MLRFYLIVGFASSSIWPQSKKMTERRKYFERLYQGEWPGDSLPDCINWLWEFISQTPPEYREKTTIEFAQDDHLIEVTIGYFRPETDQELADRRDREAAYELSKTQRDRALYEKLKAHFEPQAQPSDEEPRSGDTDGAEQRTPA